MKVEEKESPVKVDRLALGRSKDCPFRVTGEKAGNVSTETYVMWCCSFWKFCIAVLLPQRKGKQ